MPCQYCGPTTESNWVIPGVLLVGAYPASEDDTETFDLISGILKLGIRKFACLQLEVCAINCLLSSFLNFVNSIATTFRLSIGAQARASDPIFWM